MKMLRYKIKAVVDVPEEDPGEITDILDRIREAGAAIVIGVEKSEENQALPSDDDIKKM